MRRGLQLPGLWVALFIGRTGPHGQIGISSPVHIDLGPVSGEARLVGDNQRPDLAIHKFARLISAGEAIPVFGDGSMMRDFTYIDDIIDGILRAADRADGYHIYNLGESEPISLSELIARLEETLGRTAIIDRQPLQPGDVNRTFADVSLARQELGYQPSTDLRTGLARFVEWFHNDMNRR